MFGGTSQKTPEPQTGTASAPASNDAMAQPDGEPVGATVGQSPEDALKALRPIELLMTRAQARKVAPEGFEHREYKGCVERSWPKPNGIGSWDVEACYELGRLETCSSDGPCNFVERFEIEFSGFGKGEVAAQLEEAWGPGNEADHPRGDVALWRSEATGYRGMLFDGYRLEVSPYLSATSVTPAEDGTPGSAFNDIWGQTMQDLQQAYGERFEVDWDKANRVNLGRLVMPPLEGSGAPANVTLRFDRSGRMLELVVELTDDMKLGTTETVNKLLAERFPKSRQVSAPGGSKPSIHRGKAPFVWSWVGFGEVMRVAVTTKPKTSFF